LSFLPENPFHLPFRHAGLNSLKVRSCDARSSIPITIAQAQWQNLMGNNPSNFKGEDLPVTQVSWDDCIAFCRKLNEKKEGHRLPTEAQWEYACRTGIYDDYYFGRQFRMDDYAWGELDINSPIHPSGVNPSVGVSLWGSPHPMLPIHLHPVGHKKPNGWGLYDMLGNIWEWSSDRLWHYPNKKIVIDPHMVRDWSDDEDYSDGCMGDEYIVRGGGWPGTGSRPVGATYRSYASPHTRVDDLGFRVCFSSSPETQPLSFSQ
jgi:formylglycine-generating enzyme required for sulfatase activity